MNILFIFGYGMVPSVGGVQRVTDILTKEFLKMGHHVAYLAYDENPVVYNYDNYPVPQYYINAVFDNKDEIIKKFNELLRKEHITHIINQEMNKTSIFLIRNALKGIKIVSVNHTQPFSSYGKEKKIAKYMYPISLKGVLWKSILMFAPYIARIILLRKEKKILNTTANYSDRICFLSKKYIERVLMLDPEIESSKLVAINNPLPSHKF